MLSNKHVPALKDESNNYKNKKILSACKLHLLLHYQHFLKSYKI